MNPRIIGIDVARALAVIGMIIVNFKIAFGGNGSGLTKSFAEIFEGKAAATFVVLAGIGIAFMTNSAIRTNDKSKLNTVRQRILKRALFLFIVGTSYIVIWPADILHFYGIYMLLVLLFLTSKPKLILMFTALLIISYPILMLFMNYDNGWNFKSFEYSDFWTLNGFIRNLFYNGFHPVIPWSSFMLFGFWFGKQNLNSEKFLFKSFLVSIISFIVIQVFSFFSITILAEGNPQAVKELTEILGTSPMPPLPIYMLGGISIAIAIISACILIAKRFPKNKTINALNKTGQLALTFYVAHVVIGMGIVDAINPSKMGNYSIEFSVIYALVFSLICIAFASFWLKYKNSGPLEWVIRKVTK